MHSDDSYITRILLLDLPQLRKNMHTVDSAKRPEVEKNDAPAKLFKRNCMRTGMDPVETMREFRGANAR